MPTSNLSPILQLSCETLAYQGLQEGLRDKLETACREYHHLRPQDPPWRVTSARRSLFAQAAEMAAMTAEQLRGLYCHGGIPSYVEGLIQAMPLTPERAYSILCHRSEGYISKHLFGAAVDLAPDRILDQKLFRELMAKYRLTLLDERQNGIPCFHLADPDAEIRIVRE